MDAAAEGSCASPLPHRHSGPLVTSTLAMTGQTGHVTLRKRACMRARVRAFVRLCACGTGGFSLGL